MKTLGIDLGTTKVAVVIRDENGSLTAVFSRPHDAVLPRKPGEAEQDPEKIYSAVVQGIRSLPEQERKDVKAIGITGQMHSVMLGNEKEISPLITWQDHRCGTALLEEFRHRSGLNLREGFGGTTLARLAKENALSKWTFAATISDWVNARLCGRKKILTDPTHAASWGICDLSAEKWDTAAIQALGIPETILPEIHSCGENVGTLNKEIAESCGLTAGIPVINAIGDNQASILNTGKDFLSESFLTLGTGAQLSLVLDHYPDVLPPMLEVRPFPGNRFLLVAAPLCGGAAFAWLADTVNQFRTALGDSEIPRHELLDRLDRLGLAELQKGEAELYVEPHFLGERHDASLRGGIGGLTLDNCTPGKLAAALAVGIVRNLKNSFPPEILRDRKKVVGSGNGVRMVHSIQWAIEHEFGLPLVMPDTREEAASGAAALADEK